jgi:hypothetical protein
MKVGGVERYSALGRPASNFILLLLEPLDPNPKNGQYIFSASLFLSDYLGMNISFPNLESDSN